MELAEKNILIVGLARSGLAATRLLSGKGSRVTVTDLRSSQELSEVTAALPEQVQLRLGEHRLEDFLGSDLIILSPGVPLSLPALQQAQRRNIPVWSEVELAFRHLQGTFVGVTGSNGKTTTTTLIGKLLSAAEIPCAVAGNIGTPLSSLAGRSEKQLTSPLTYVVELSSFQLEAIDCFHCHIALLLNLSPDHLDRYRDLGEYLEAKKRIFLNQTQADFAVLNADQPGVASLKPELKAQTFFFSRKRQLESGIFIVGDRIRVRWQEREYEVMGTEQIPLPGGHNQENVLAALATAFLLNVSVPVMSRTLARFTGVEHRLEKVRSLNGVDFYNDSKATNIDSACKALEAFQRPLVLIMGGLDKEGNFRTLRPLVRQRVRHLILLGKAAEKIKAALSDVVPTTRASTLEEAVQAAYHLACSGDVVLLAPACASYDMFRDYEHRGQVFKEAVWKLNHATPEAITT